MSKSLTVTTPKAIAPDADVLTLMDDWRAALDLRVSAGELAETTAVTYKRGMEKFIAWAGRRHRVTDDTLREWKAALLADGHKPGAINTWLSGVRAFFAWAVGARRLLHNPAAAIKGAKRGKSRSWITTSEVYQMTKTLA